MKKLFQIFLFLAIAQSSIAQSDSVRFEIVISDPAAINGTSPSGLPIFANPTFNSILSSYYVTEFRQAYAGARMRHLRSVYLVKCNSIALATDLKAANATIFPSWQRKAQKELGFTPNDWNKAISDGSNYLDYIKAREAWNITKGDPSVVIGVNDNWLFTSHPDFYNTGGGSKFNYVGYNPIPLTGPWDYSPDAPSYHHGTTVSSLVAGGTDNNIGLPAIGFNCQLSFTSMGASEYELLNESKKGIRMINCSWYYLASTPTLNLRDHFNDQEFFNDIYENGTLLFFCAANGDKINPNDYAFPASYDHVFSTTSIGWQNDKSVTNINVKGMHELTLGNTSSTYQHNSRVDLCAPTYLGAARWDPRVPTVEYYNSASGTSSSSPLVAGTAGLIQAALKAKLGTSVNYSPYQLEWILKNSANTDFLSYPENAAYAGRLGAGRLDAEMAVKKVVGIGTSALSPNDPTTQTMYIKGIDINTICAPGYASNGVKPKLKPIIVNGTPPYTYVWEEVQWLNNAILDDENIAEPTVVGIKAGSSTNVIYYRLTVYDSSPTAQKVAMKTFKIQMKTSGFDLAVRDSYMDMMDEPNTQTDFDQRDWDIWTSPDLWNRQSADAGTEHQNPEYFVSAPNHIYTRVRNVGCAANSNDHILRLYWTKASTGENWDADWKYATVCGIGALQPGGKEITASGAIAIPVIQPGDVSIIHKEWNPIQPQLYCGAPSSFDVCLLARVVQLGGILGEYNMVIPEKFTWDVGYKGVKENINNNNNIATRNFVLTNLQPDNIKTYKRQLTVANGNSTATTYNFEFASERSIFRHFAGDFSSLGSVTLYLGDLYDAWVAAGSLGTVASQNANLRSVTFDGANTLHLDSIPFAANQKYVIEVEFALDTPAIVPEVSEHLFHARQFDVATPTDVYGAVNYKVVVSPAANQSNWRKTNPSPALTEVQDAHFALSPNPTSGIFRIVYTGQKANKTEMIVTDMAGKKILTRSIHFSPNVAQEINLSGTATGVYLVHITDSFGKTEVYKVIKE